MAYLFNRLNEMIDGQQAPRASDVLGQQQAGGMKPAQQDRETPGAQGIASQPSAIIGGQGAPKPAAAGEDPTAVSSESRAKIFQKNQNAELQADPNKSAFGGYRNSIAQMQGDLQKQANSYVDTVKYNQVSDDTVNQAVRAGDEKATTAVRDLLYGAAPAAKEWGYDDSSLTTARDAVKGFNSTGGRKNLLMGEGNRTSGEANLDAALLGRSKAFSDQRGELINQFAGFKQDYDAADKRAKEAVTMATQNRETDKGRVRGSIGGIASRILGEADARAVQENAAREELRSRAVGVEAKRIEDAARAAGVDPNIVKPVSSKPLYSVAGDVTGRDLLTDDEVGDYNTAQELLGDGTRATVGRGAGARETFDEAALAALIAKARQVQRTPEPTRTLSSAAPGAMTPAEQQVMQARNSVLDANGSDDGAQRGALQSGGSAGGTLQVVNKPKAPPPVDVAAAAAPWGGLATGAGDAKGMDRVLSDVGKQAAAKLNPKDPKSINTALNMDTSGASYKKLADAKMTPDQVWDLYKKNGMDKGQADTYAGVEAYAKWYQKNVNRNYTFVGKGVSGPKAGGSIAASGSGGTVMGGKWLCGAMHSLGYLADDVYAADLAYSATVSAHTRLGYSVWARPLADLVQTTPWLARAVKPVVLAWANEMAGRSSRLGRALKRYGEPACAWLGRRL